MAIKIIDRAFSFLGFERRATSNSPTDPIWGPLLQRAKSGATVTADTALNVSAVYACVRVLAESIASLPLMVYQRRKGGGKDIATEHSLYALLHDSPNPFMTSFELRELLMGHLCLRGNAFIFKEQTGGDEIVNLIPLNPSYITLEKTGNEIIYKYRVNGQAEQKFTKKEIWHIKGLSTDGMQGVSPITLAREAIGLYIATEEHGARLFSNYAKPGGILKHPGKLTEEASKRLKKSWTEAHAGGANAHKTALLEEGLSWESIGFSNEDSQFLETRNFQIEDIARIFRVPSVLIGHPDKNSTYASAEQFFLSFVVHTIRPWLVRIEQSINKNLLTEKERKKYFVEHKVDGLLRGDIKSRYDAYAIGRQNKWLNANEIRDLENLNPIDGGDIYENPNIQVNGGNANANSNGATNI